MDAHDRFRDDDTTTVFVRTQDGLRPTAAPSRPSASPGHSDGLWDANDVARYLKVSRSWVYHRAEAGLLPYIRVGGLLRFDRAAITAMARGEALPSKRVVAFTVKSRA